MGAWIRADERRKIFVAAAAAVALVSLAYALNIRTVFFGQHAVTAIDDIGEAVAAALAPLPCVWAPSRPAGKARPGWALTGASTPRGPRGEVAWSLSQVRVGVK